MQNTESAITPDILQQFQGKTGTLVGMPIGNVVICLDVSNQRPTNGLVSMGHLNEPSADNYQLTIVKKEKNNKEIKEISLVHEQSSKPMKIISVLQANRLLSRIIAISTTKTQTQGVIIGYKYRGQAYLPAELPTLYAAISSQLKEYNKKMHDIIENSKLLLQPLSFEVQMIRKLEIGQNKISSLSEQERTITSLMDISQGQNKFKQILENSQESTNGISFLGRLPIKMPDKMANIHQFLPSQQLWQHKIYFCKGRYEFYHYGEQEFNDRGWGCAYRSFQTVLSWFNQQRLTDIEIPTIREIQKYLFDIDKTRNLVNTNEWIGANEVGWLIKKLCNVECKIVHLSDGSNIMEKVDTFRHHFQTSGTPIMYGGDMYAYTIVGINYSWETSECLFCIVDPHYTEDNTIKQVTTKEGVYWKDKSKLFKKGAYYNFCLPQLPQSI